MREGDVHKWCGWLHLHMKPFYADLAHGAYKHRENVQRLELGSCSTRWNTLSSDATRYSRKSDKNNFNTLNEFSLLAASNYIVEDGDVSVRSHRPENECRTGLFLYNLCFFCYLFSSRQHEHNNNNVFTKIPKGTPLFATEARVFPPLYMLFFGRSIFFFTIVYYFLFVCRLRECTEIHSYCIGV